MQNAFSSMENMLGEEKTDKLARARIAVFGLGGVGSFAVEALARCGVGSLTLVDFGHVRDSGFNRQIYALRSAVGKPLTQAAKERVYEIDEDILVHTYETRYCEETAAMFDLKSYDYVIDAMNRLPAKLLLIKKARQAGIPVITCTSTDDLMDPTRLAITDIYRTSVCPAAKIMRAELKAGGVRKVKALFSRERRGPANRKEPVPPDRKPGNICYVTGMAGLMIAGEVVRDLLA